MRDQRQRVAILALLLSVLLAACTGSGQPDASVTERPADAAVQAGESASTPGSAEETCAANARVALDFLNLYLRHLNGQTRSAADLETYDWLKANLLADASLASAYMAFHDTGADPILNAQDFPGTFVSIGCPANSEVVVLEGVEMDISVPVKVVEVAGLPKVVGAGLINIAASEWLQGSPEAAAETCVDAWLVAHRAEVGEDAVVTMDQFGEWERWCAGGNWP